ncbi:MAG: hypothetical protein LBR23_08735 [Spirochaetaceae bacterium]|nr:hypothetical protein [Spirochaetaceae bacterium]
MPVQNVFISVVSLGEIVKGIEKNHDAAKREALKKSSGLFQPVPRQGGVSRCLALFLILAVSGLFMLSEAESLRSVKFKGERSVSAFFHTPGAAPVDCGAVLGAGNAGTGAFSALRSGSLRHFAFSGAQGLRLACILSPYRGTLRTAKIIPRAAMLLKLRI